MGNAKIQDRMTGAVMGLRNGFIPVGIKEHGGIVYIASFNPNTKESELGSIPSPIFNYQYNFKGQEHTIKKELLNTNLASVAPIQLSNEHFSVGDCVYFDLDITEGNGTITRGAIDYPIITNAAATGLVSLHLYANCDDSTYSINLNQYNQSHDTTENRWYHRYDPPASILTETTIKTLFANGDVIKYPNFKSGTLNILPVIETPTNFQVISSELSEVQGPYYYDDPNNGIWVIIPGIQYQCSSPLWVDKIIATATIEGKTQQIFQCPQTYKDLLSNTTPFSSIVDARYNQPYVFTRYIDNDTHRLYPTYNQTLKFENNIYSGGLFCVNIGNSLNTKVIINIKLIADTFYNKTGDDTYTENTIYSNFTQEYIVGDLEIEYNPYASTRPINIDVTTPKTLLSLYIDSDKAPSDNINLNWDHLLHKVSTTLDSTTLDQMVIGPKTLGTESISAARLKNGDSKSVRWFDELAEQILSIKSNYLLLDDDVKILIFNDKSDQWYKNCADNSPDIKWFSGYKTPLQLSNYTEQFCSLAISTNQTLDLGLESSTTIALNNEGLKDLKFYYPNLGSAELKISTPSDLSPQCTWRTSAAYSMIDDTLVLNNIFPYTESIKAQVASTYLDSKHYRLYLFDPGKNDYLDEVRNNILQDTPTDTNNFSYPESNVGTDQFMSIQLDNPSVTSFTSTVRFPKVSGVSYASVIMPKGSNDIGKLQDVHTLKNNFVGLDGYKKVSLVENYPTFILENTKTTFTLINTPELINQSGYKAVQQIILGDEKTGWVLGNNIISKNISVDTDKPIEILEVIHNGEITEETSIVKPTAYQIAKHSFKQSITWYRPDEGTGKISLYIKESGNQPDQWYLIKWSTRIPFMDSGYNICLKKGFIPGEAFQIEPIKSTVTENYNLFKEKYYSDFYVGNFGVFKVTDPIVIEKAEAYLLNYPNDTVITDINILQLLSLPHCAAVFEYAERFKGVGISNTNANGDDRISILYNTYYLPDPKYFCFGYYSLEETTDQQHKIIVPLGHKQKEGILQQVIENISIKQIDDHGISNN